MHTPHSKMSTAKMLRCGRSRNILTQLLTRKATKNERKSCVPSYKNLLIVFKVTAVSLCRFPRLYPQRLPEMCHSMFRGLLDVSLLCQFAIWTFRFHLRGFATCLQYLDALLYLDGSPPGRFGPLDVSIRKADIT